jgi:hypothetical protein
MSDQESGLPKGVDTYTDHGVVVLEVREFVKRMTPLEALGLAHELLQRVKHAIESPEE